MIEEIRKRPFVRPLFLWITGILLYVVFPTIWLGLLFCLLSCLIMGLFWAMKNQVGHYPSYDFRWVWGAVFVVVILSFAIQVSYFSDRGIPSSGKLELVYKIAVQAQYSLVEAYDGLSLPDDHKSVLATLTLGYKQAMSQTMRARFSMTGVSHVLAVSGFHVAVVGGFFSLLCSVLPERGWGRWVRGMLLIGLLWMFAFITGLAPSTIRATFMLSLFQVGRMFRRTGDRYNTLATAAFCMLVCNPFYLFDVGFQLSFLAVWFILFLASRMGGWIRVRNPLLDIPWQWIVVSVAAQAGTALLAGYYFGQFPVVFLFVNIPVILLATCLIPLAFLWLLCPVWFPGYEVLQRVVEILIRVMVAVVEVFSKVTGASIPVHLDFIDLLGGYAICFLFLSYVKTRKPRLMLWALVMLFVLFLKNLVLRFFP